jgi:hypothetical protein
MQFICKIVFLIQFHMYEYVYMNFYTLICIHKIPMWAMTTAKRLVGDEEGKGKAGMGNDDGNEGFGQGRGQGRQGDKGGR